MDFLEFRDSNLSQVRNHKHEISLLLGLELMQLFPEGIGR